MVEWICASTGYAKVFPTIDTPLSNNIKIGGLILISLLPASLMFISLIGMKLYPLDDKAMEKVQAEIARKKTV